MWGVRVRQKGSSMDASREQLHKVSSSDAGGSILALLLEDLEDPNPRVRALAVKEMLDYRDSVVIERLIHLAQHDPDLEVRCTAISGMGIFGYLGGICAYDPETEHDIVETSEGLSNADLQRVYRFLLSLCRDDSRPLDERRVAVEALSFFANDTVENLIAELYAMPSKEARCSALVAMGRNGSRRWVDILRRELYGPDRDIRLHAIAAAGEVGPEALGKDLWRLTYSDDREVMLAAVWALGQTGWEGAFERLDELTLDDDPEVCQVADEAMDEWLFFNGLGAAYDDGLVDEDDLDDLEF